MKAMRGSIHGEEDWFIICGRCDAKVLELSLVKVLF